MNTRNVVVLTGNLGSDPQIIKKERDGGAVTRLSLAISDYRYNSDADSYEQSHTNWIPVTAFSALATRAAENLKKGALITVYGKLKSNTFEAKGVTQTKLEVIAEDILISDVLPKSAKEAFGDITKNISQFSAEGFDRSSEGEESLEQ